MCTKPSEPLKIKRIQCINLAWLTKSNLSFSKNHVVWHKYRYRPSYSPVQRSLIQKSVMPTSREGINKEPRNQWLCNVVLRLMIFLFDSHQMARLPLMDLVRITDKINDRTARKTRTDVTLNILLCSVLLCSVTVFCVTVFCVTVQNLAKLTHPRILEKNIFLELSNLCIYGNTVPQIDLTISSTNCKFKVVKYGFIHAHIAYWWRNFLLDAVLLRVLSGTNDKTVTYYWLQVLEK